MKAFERTCVLTLCVALAACDGHGGAADRETLDSVRFTDPDSARCAYPKFVGLPEGVWVMVEQGVVGRIDVQKGAVATAEASGRRATRST